MTASTDAGIPATFSGLLTFESAYLRGSDSNMAIAFRMA